MKASDISNEELAAILRAIAFTGHLTLDEKEYLREAAGRLEEQKLCNVYEERGLKADTVVIDEEAKKPYEDAVSREPCRTCKYGEIYNDAWCRCTHYRISGYRLPIKNGCEVENCYKIAPYKDGENEV